MKIALPFLAFVAIGALLLAQDPIPPATPTPSPSPVESPTPDPSLAEPDRHPRADSEAQGLAAGPARSADAPQTLATPRPLPTMSPTPAPPPRG